MARTLLTPDYLAVNGGMVPCGIADRVALQSTSYFAMRARRRNLTMKYRLTALAVLLALASAFIFAPFSAMAGTKDKQALKNIPVTGSLPDGGTFKGKV